MFLRLPQSLAPIRVRNDAVAPEDRVPAMPLTLFATDCGTPAQIMSRTAGAPQIVKEPPRDARRLARRRPRLEEWRAGLSASRRNTRCGVCAEAGTRVRSTTTISGDPTPLSADARELDTSVKNLLRTDS